MHNLAIGNAEDSLRATNKQFDAAVNVAIDLDFQEEFRWRHKVGLLDGIGNDPYTFMAAVLLVYSLIRKDKRVLLHCQEGTSRSVMVAATYVAAKGLATFDEALQKIMAERKIDNYRPSLYDMAQKVLPNLKELMK